MEVYTLDTALIKKLTDTGYQHFSLCNGEGKKIVSFNPEKKNTQKKIDEIKKRFANLPDGLYQLLCNWNYGGAGSPDIFLLKKGVAPVEQVLSAPGPNRTLKENKQENVLSYETALQNIQTIAELQALNRELTAENLRLNTELDVLENELKVFEDKPLSDGEQGGAIGKWLSEIIPVLSPIADRYFDTENKKLSIQEREQYYKYGPGQNQQQKKGPTIVRRGPKQPVKNNIPLPDINDQEQVNKFFDALEQLDEQKFIEVVKLVQEQNQPLYELIEIEFTNQEQTDEPE